MIFYVGTHMLSHAQHLERSFISVNRLRGRRSDFKVNYWILDSGAFTEISTFGNFRTSTVQYATDINRWRLCGNLELAVTQDYMCEQFILQKTGLTIKDHQKLTIQRYDELIKMSLVPIMPVLQGYQPEDYLRHIEMYGDLLKPGMRVGVGSVCKRNKNIRAITLVLEPIKKVRPDLRLHGFGLKLTALADTYIASMLYSADSMAWSYHARKTGGNANGVIEAMEFANRIQTEGGRKASQLVLV